MLDIERNIIGSILLSPESIVKMKITADMFSDPTLGQIFADCKELESKGEEISPLRIATNIQSGVMSKAFASEYISEIVSGHDAAASDEYCCKELRKRFRANQVNKILDHIEINPDNVDSLIEELQRDFDGLKEVKGNDAVRFGDLITWKGDYFKDRGNKIFDTGLKKVDDTIGSLDAGDLILIAARPSVGKSAFSLQLARRYGRKGLKVGYFNLEMTAKQVYERAIATTSGIKMNRIRNATGFLNNEKELFDKGNEILSQERNLYLYNDNFTVGDIRAKQMVNKYDVIFVDYLQLVKPDKPRATRREEVGEISKGLKRIAMEYQIPVIALSQLNRASEMNKDKEPTMAELRDSGDLEQDASTVLMMWNSNPADRSEKMLKVEKGRQTGDTKIKLVFNGGLMAFTEEDDFMDIPDNMEIPF
jgi:replicative DNA helicase